MFDYDAYQRKQFYEDFLLGDDDDFEDLFESDLASSKRSRRLECTTFEKLPPPGKCTRRPIEREDRCRNGFWYMPIAGDTLWEVARDVLRANGETLSTKKYMEIVSSEPENRMFIRPSTGLATLAFSPIWSQENGRTKKVGRPRGRYGLIFMPSPSGKRLACPYGPSVYQWI